MSAYNTWRQFDGAVAYSVSVPASASGAAPLWSLLSSAQQLEIGSNPGVIAVRAQLQPVGDIFCQFAAPGTAVPGSNTPGTVASTAGSVTVAGGTAEDIEAVRPDLTVFLAGDTDSTTCIVIFYLVNTCNIN